MSITDELRAAGKVYAGVYTDMEHVDYDKPTFDALCDRIDAEHQKALDEWKAKHGQMWLKGYSECHAELLEGNETLASDLERCGWVRLPKDADGEYIHIGDKLIDEDDKPQKPAIVKCILYNDEGCVVSDIDPRGCWYDPSLLRHYHAPTVEDVLREFSEKMNENLGMYTGEAIDADEWRKADERTIAEYAKRLTLADGEDA